MKDDGRIRMLMAAARKTAWKCLGSVSACLGLKDMWLVR